MNSSTFTSMKPVVAARPVSRTDEELLLAYRKDGDREAFNELVHRYERDLFNYLHRYLGDAAAAEDAFQATFLQVHLKCQQFEEGRKVRPWLYTVATHQAIDAQRRGRRHKMASLDRRHGNDDEQASTTLLDLLASRESNPTAALEQDERRRWIRNALGMLPEALRSAVTLIYYQGLKYREVADIQHLPVGTIKSRVHAAIVKLNEMWHAQHGTVDENQSHA